MGEIINIIQQKIISYKVNQDDQYNITNVTLAFNDGWQTDAL